MRWTREKAAAWIRSFGSIATEGDFEHVVIDGDGRQLYEAKPSHNVDLSPEELGELLAFVFNDYAASKPDLSSIVSDSPVIGAGWTHLPHDNS
jgi:hypothetical protein